MAPTQRKRSATAQRNLDQLHGGRQPSNEQHDGYQRGPMLKRLVLVANYVRSFSMSMLAPNRAWLLVFLPSFFRYMVLLRTSLRPRPLQLGTVSEALPGSFGGLVSPQARLEIVAEGLDGMLAAPVWRHDPALGRGYLLFSQVDRNRVWRWEEGGGAFTIGRSLFLEQAGCHRRVLQQQQQQQRVAQPLPPPLQHSLPVSCEGVEGVGALALALAPKGAADADGARLVVLVEGGNRRVTRLETNGTRTVLHATWKHNHHHGATANSAAFAADGSLFLTVPPPPSANPLPIAEKSSTKAKTSTDAKAPAGSSDKAVVSKSHGWVIAVSATTTDNNGPKTKNPPNADFPGAAKLDRTDLLNDLGDSEGLLGSGEHGGGVLVAVRDVVDPSGLAFSPDGKTLFVAEANPENPHWRAYDVVSEEAGQVFGRGAVRVDPASGRVFARPPPAPTSMGTPRGLCVDSKGNVFAAFGEGGVLVFAKKTGELMGTIDTGGVEASGTAFGDDGFLYITARSSVLRVPVKALPGLKAE